MIRRAGLLKTTNHFHGKEWWTFRVRIEGMIKHDIPPAGLLIL